MSGAHPRSQVELAPEPSGARTWRDILSSRVYRLDITPALGSELIANIDCLGESEKFKLIVVSHGDVKLCTGDTVQCDCGVECDCVYCMSHCWSNK